MGTCRGFLLLVGLCLSTAGWAEGKRAIVLDDLANYANLSSPSASSDGKWVAYTVGRDDLEENESQTQVWVSAWDGSRLTQFTTAKESSTSPGYSPDGKWLALLSSRGREDGASQFCVMPSDGGEARCLTDLPGGVSEYDWAPDSKRVVLVSKLDPEYDPEADEDKKPEPIVIDRYHFKQDYVGFMRKERSHLFLFNIETEESVQLTDGNYEEFSPSFSPDGKRIAFSSKHGEDPDRHDNSDVYVMDATAGAEARQLTTNQGADGRPKWSPDGKSIAYLHGGSPDLAWYGLVRIGIVPADGGEARVLTADLDRNASSPQWSANGKDIYFLLEDDQSVQLAKVPAKGGKITRLTPAGQVVAQFEIGPAGIVMLTSSPSMPYELQVLEGSSTRQLTHHNAWLDNVALAQVKAISFNSADGTEVHALLMTPVAADDGLRPTLMRLHGGPVSQRQYELEFNFQLLAAHGYMIVAPNFRGSTGRGEDFQRAIFADWGHVHLEDSLAAVDYLVDKKLADPDRLGVFGWSYGGILTNYVIASDSRFKVAISGASMSNMLGGYGHDQYITVWNSELGAPWENLDTWLKLSYPFLHADRITTPTLFLVGQEDWNVPLHATEQMYQALKQLEVETEMVIYPGEHHGLSSPVFKVDRLQRYIDWFDKHLGTVGQE